MDIVGNSYPVHDAVEKASGKALYAGDIRLNGMLYAALICSTIPHGVVKDIDFKALRRIPGVVGYVSCLDGCGNMFSRYRTRKGQATADQENVWNKRVRFVGDRIGCVIAKNLETARRAAAKVKVKYSEFPYALTAEESLSGKIFDIHAEGSVTEEITAEVGEIPSGDDFLRISTRSFLPRINHVAIEPHTCTADYNKLTGELTVWSHGQSVHGIRTVLGDIFDIPYHKIRVIKTTMGGSFGGKQEWAVEPAAAAAAIYAGRPVQLVMSREEVFRSTICRSPMDIKVEGLYSHDGKIMSLCIDNTLDAGAYLGSTKDYCAAMSNKFYRCYNYPHMKYTGRAVITNTPVSGGFRGWTAPEFAICAEHNINMAARKLGIDPVEIRIKNAAHPGDMDRKLNVSLGEIRIIECLERGRQMFNWAEKRKEDAEFNSNSVRFRRGSAVACGGHVNGYFPRVSDFAGVSMRLTETGDVIVTATIHDLGCGAVQVIRMITAEALCVKPDAVKAGEGDTAFTPFDNGCMSSRTTYVIGKAAELCAQQLLKRIKETISQVYGVAENELTAHDGALHAFGKIWTYAQAAVDSHTKLQKEISAVYQHINHSNPGVTGAHFAHVEVDTATGNVKILDYLAVHDIGKAINPEICRAQIQGAVLMGAGAALSEEVTTDAKGVSLGTLSKYHIINIADAPEIRVEFVEDMGTEGPFGSKSIGEISHVPPTAAVVSAVNEALESDMCRLPLNQDRICAWIEENADILWSKTYEA